MPGKHWVFLWLWIFLLSEERWPVVKRLKRHLVVAVVTGDVLDGRVSKLVFFE